MRFAAVPPARRQPTEPCHATAQARRGPEGKPHKLVPAQPDPLKTAELPIDLDQRVRLVGEW